VNWRTLLGSKVSRREAAVVAALVGDAAGLPYEGLDPEQLPSFDDPFRRPEGFTPQHPGIARGRHSDDGSEILALLDSLLECRKFDADDFGRRLRAWHDEGHYTVDGQAFGVGSTTRSAIERLRAGVPAAEAGLGDMRHLGNGSLMRVPALIAWHEGTAAELVELATAQSSVTHTHPIARMACALYAVIGRILLDAPATRIMDAAHEAALVVSRHVASADQEAAEVVGDYVAMHRPEGRGFVLDSLATALWANRQDTLAGTVCAAIRLGRDADTSACLAGALGALRLGLDVPEAWLDVCACQVAVAGPIVRRLADRVRRVPREA
jgi:ADP-ribosylglycohydrolase